MSEPGRIAELAHKRHRENQMTEAEVLAKAFREGMIGRVGGPLLLFERAMLLHAPKEWEERKAEGLVK